MLDYILTWRLLAGLLMGGLSLIPVRKIFQMLRNGEIWRVGSVREVFLSSLSLGIGAAFHPLLLVGFPVLWLVLLRKHLISWKGFYSSLLAIAIVALYTAIVLYLFPSLSFSFV